MQFLSAVDSWHVAKNFGRRAYSSSASWGRMLLSQQAVRRFSRALDSRDFTVPTGTPRIWAASWQLETSIYRSFRPFDAVEVVG
jgi:hypothetical protein